MIPRLNVLDVGAPKGCLKSYLILERDFASYHVKDYLYFINLIFLIQFIQLKLNQIKINNKVRLKKMAKWECTACGWIYDEEKEGKAFEDLPDDYVCPVCGVGKDMFEKQ